jgi:hypothetical protein
MRFTAPLPRCPATVYAADPFHASIREILALPDRYSTLQLLYHVAAGGERVIPMRRRSNHGNCRVADFKPTDTVLHADSHIPSRLGFRYDAATFGFGHGRVRRVLEAKNLPASVMIPDGADEACDATPLG